MGGVMSSLLITAVTTEDPERPLLVGRITVDAGEGYVNLDLGSAIPRRGHEAGGRWISLHPDEARALAAALRHYAKVVER